MQENPGSKRLTAAVVDRGYRGCKRIAGTEVLIPSPGARGQTYYEIQKRRKGTRRRADIKPVIGHLN